MVITGALFYFICIVTSLSDTERYISAAGKAILVPIKPLSPIEYHRSHHYSSRGWPCLVIVGVSDLTRGTQIYTGISA